MIKYNLLKIHEKKKKVNSDKKIVRRRLIKFIVIFNKAHTNSKNLNYMFILTFVNVITIIKYYAINTWSDIIFKLSQLESP